MHITAITFIAAIVNGALGGGLPSMTVPYVLTNRVPTPVLISLAVVLTWR